MYVYFEVSNKKHVSMEYYQFITGMLLRGERSQVIGTTLSTLHAYINRSILSYFFMFGGTLHIGNNWLNKR